MPTQTPGGGFDVAHAAAAAREALEKAKKACLYQKQIQMQLAALRAAEGLGGSLPGGADPALLLRLSGGASGVGSGVSLGRCGGPLLFDNLGRELDERGRVVEAKPQVHSTLKININRERKQRIKQILQSAGRTERSLTDPTQNKHFDANIIVKRTRRKGFQFVAEGAFVKQEQQMLRQAEARVLGINLYKLHSEKEAMKMEEEALRKMKKVKDRKRDKPALEAPADMEENDELMEQDEDGSRKRIREEESETSESSGDELNPNLIPLGGIVGAQVFAVKSWDLVPDLEWWDRAAYKETTDHDIEHDEPIYILDTAKITRYVEHPIPIVPFPSDDMASAPKMYLTKVERKKLRRRRRQEKEREKQDQVRMGLIPAAPPKVKLSNLMRVLGDSAVADPSRVEREVRLQMEQRIKAHETRNQMRKLEPQVKRVKKAAKWKQDASGDFQVVVFSVKTLANKRHLYKIDVNASQMHLTGCCVICPNVDCNIVVVEGSGRAVKRFKRLMLHRIRWEDKDEEEAEEEEEEEPEEPQSHNLMESDELDVKLPTPQSQFCNLVWEGTLRRRNFSTWKIHPCKAEPEARLLLKANKAEHYWDAVRKHRDAILDL
eukprot:GHVS01012741.1.p1 GENE.GHVS01012741.1~~GHVS01012741.1.p1  ORF type:complete len:650 (+),score=141.83 GHVS01012741.1:137-1951(+)